MWNTLWSVLISVHNFYYAFSYTITTMRHLWWTLIWLILILTTETAVIPPITKSLCFITLASVCLTLFLAFAAVTLKDLLSAIIFFSIRLMCLYKVYKSFAKMYSAAWHKLPLFKSFVLSIFFTFFWQILYCYDHYWIEKSILLKLKSYDSWKLS